MTIPLITTFPVPPDSGGGRAAFVAAANKFGDDLLPFGTELNATAVAVNARATDADTAAGDAAQAKVDAEAARDSAIAASTSIADDYDDAGVVYAKNDLVWDGAGQLYLCILGYTSTATRPSADPTHWVRVNTTPDDIDAAIAAAEPDAPVSTAQQAAIDALRNIPANAQSTAYTLTLTDAGKSIDTTANVVIPANSSVAFPVGTTIMVTNTGSASRTISITTDTLRLAGTATTGTRTLAGYGMCTMRKVSATVWFISGAGLS